jgi:hypothetical protein
MLYKILSACDWSGVYGTSIDVAVASLSAAVRNATEQALPRGCNRKPRFPPWFSNTLRYYIVKNNYFYRRLKKKPTDFFYDKSSSTESLLKTLSSLAGLEG